MCLSITLHSTLIFGTMSDHFLKLLLVLTQQIPYTYLLFPWYTFLLFILFFITIYSVIYYLLQNKVNRVKLE